MTDIKIEDPRIIASLWVADGIHGLVKELEEQQSKLPGMGLALSIARRQLAGTRMQQHSFIFKAVAAAGIDLSKTEKVSTMIKNGEAVIQVTYDDEAEAE